MTNRLRIQINRIAMMSIVSKSLTVAAAFFVGANIMLPNRSEASQASNAARLVFCQAEKNEIRIETDAAGRIIGIIQNGVALEISESRITPQGKSIATAISFEPIGAVMASADAADLAAISAGMIQVDLEVMGAPGTPILSPRALCTVIN